MVKLFSNEELCNIFSDLPPEEKRNKKWTTKDGIKIFENLIRKKYGLPLKKKVKNGTD